MAALAVGGRLLPLQHAVIAHHAGDTQPVIVKHALPAGRLRRALRIAPDGERRLLAAFSCR